MFHTRGLHVLGTTFSTTVFSGAAAVERQRPGLDLDDAGVVEGGQNLRRATASRPSVSCVVGVVSLGWSQPQRATMGPFQRRHLSISPPKIADFRNKICQQRTRAVQQKARDELFDYLIG